MKRLRTILAILALVLGGGSALAQGFAPPLAPASPSAWIPCTGTIASATDAVECDVTGSASATLTVSGTFSGTIQVQGSSALQGSGAPLGGRLLFKSGVGSLGTNWLVGDGTTAVSAEYRIVTGGRRVRISFSSWTSGSASVVLTATASGSTVFVNGPVHTAEEEAVRTGRGFVVSTGVASVPSGNYLNFVLANPAGSGRNVFISLRKYATSSSSVLTYQNRSNPTPISGGTSATPANRRNDVSTASVATFTYLAQSQNISTGVAGATGFVPPNGEDVSVTALRMLAPGTSLGVSIGGSGGGFTATAGCLVDLSWYEEPVN